MNKALLLLLLTLCLAGTAHTQVEFSFGSDSISAPGGFVDVDVEISGFDDIVSMQLSLNWDPNVFSFSSITNVTDVLPEFSLGNIGTPENAIVVDNGELTISWSRVSTNPETLPNNTRLFTLRLLGDGPLCGSTQVEISNNPRVIEIVNNDFDELTATATGGNLAIYDASCENNGGGDLLSFSLESSSASAGSTICIPVTADNFTDIFSFQTGVSWDPSVLRFTELKDAGLQSVTANATNADNGNINVLWFFDQAAVSLADGATLFELCFEVIGNTGQTSGISLVNLPNFNIEVGIESGTVNNFDINNAIFTVGSGSGGGMNGAGLLAGDIFTNNSPTICIPITTKNFDQVAAFQAGINYDPNVLTFTSVMDGELSAVNVGATASAQGNLRVLWSADFSTPSVTLPDDAVLFTLCFDVIGAAGTQSAIGFVNLPDFGIEFSSETGSALEFFVQDGSITVGTMMNSTSVSLTASSASVERGDEVCVDITTTGFTDVQGMGFALQWDPTVLTFVDQRNFNLSGLGASSFSTLGNDRLALLWTPTSSQTVADGTSIFQVCFRAADPCGPATSSAISFVRGNTDIEIIGSNNEVLNADLNNGNVMITDCTVDPGNFRIIVLSSSDPSCNGNTNGVVNVDFSGESGVVMCLWSRDSDGLNITANCNLLGVPGGDYTLNASDQAGNTATTRVTLNDPTAIVVDGDIINGSCTGSGEVSVRVSGGTSANGTYTYSWSSGLPPNAQVTGLEPGTYRVSVSDDNGCVGIQDFVVNDNSFPITPVVTNVTNMDQPNGSIELNPAAGANLSYLWNTGETTPSISGIAAGTYSVTITDNVGTCTTDRTFTVGAGFISGTSIVDGATARYNGFGVSCNGEADGMLDGDVSGGCADGPIVILLNGTAVTLPANNLPAGEHVLRIEDACGNVFEETFILEEPDAIALNGTISETCPSDNANNGTIELDISGGTGVYSLTPSVGRSTTGTIIDDLPADPFTVIVQDENGCQVMFENIQIDPGSCNPGPSGDPCEGRTIISPNGDNVNDIFVIPCVNDPENQPNNLTIYDRWGNLVLEASNYSNSWNGTDLSGDPLPEGGYMWVLTTGGAGSRDLFRGTVSILR